ncbi:MAG TPA: methyltransferase type 11, partial [Candidatus Thermoplasmatota archaeon]
PGGWVVVGEGFWMREPDPEYLAALGATRDELGEGGWVEEAARGIGLEVVEAWTSTREAWDAYEGALLRGVERYVEEALADRDGPKMLEEQRAFHAAQMRWGRETMGFAVHLFRRPGHPPQ